MNAIILAGGFGSRLRPLTENVPKPMLPVANRPMLDYVVSQLKSYYINDMIFTLGYKGEQVREFAEGYDEVRVRFTTEDKPLGTAGAVKQAEKMLSDSFVVISGDALSDVDLDEMIKRHFDSGALVTMAVTEVENPTLYGVVQTDKADRIIRFVEKPETAEYGRLVNTGIYIVDKSVLSLVPGDTAFDFSRDLFPALLGSGRMSVYRHDGYWCDIGDKKSYYEANFRMKGGAFFEPAERKEPDLISETTGTNLTASSAIVLGTASGCVIGKRARVASSARIKDCVVLDGATVTGTHEGAIIGDGFVENIRLMPNAIEGKIAEVNNLLQSAL